MCVDDIRMDTLKSKGGSISSVNRYVLQILAETASFQKRHLEGSNLDGKHTSRSFNVCDTVYLKLFVNSFSCTFES